MPSTGTNTTANTPAPTGPIDYSAAAPYQAAAQNAQNNVATLTESGPGLLQALQQNLTGIFAKDNPAMSARADALTTFLNTPSATRAALLPSNLPVVAGSNLNLSPTQQNAIVTGRQNAALVPLAGLNQLVTGMYGNIPQLVQRAGDIYSALISGATTRADLAQKQYETIAGQAQAQENARIEQQRIAAELAGNQALRANKILQGVALAAKSGADLKTVMGAYANNVDVTPDQVLATFQNNGGQVNLDPTTLVSLYHVTPQGAGVVPIQPVSVKTPGPIPFLPGIGSFDYTKYFNPVTQQFVQPGNTSGQSGWPSANSLLGTLYGSSGNSGRPPLSSFNK